MENNHHFLLKLSRLLFPSSFTSCQSQTLTDIVSNKTSINYTFTKPNKIPHENDPFDAQQRKYFPLHKIKTHQECKKNIIISSSSPDSCPSEEDNFFTLSSNSGDQGRILRSPKKFHPLKYFGSSSASAGDSFCRKTRKVCAEYQELGSDCISTDVYYNSKKIENRCRSRRKTEKGLRKIKKGWVVEEGFAAVEKSSSDPYGDFRASMVEMILEKQRFGTGDLERLLFCFLSLNDICHHGIIVDVFYEVCETLFCN